MISDEWKLLEDYIETRNKHSNNLEINKKFLVQLFINIVKAELDKLNITTSSPNVFINGVKHEIDLLILKKDTIAKLIYEPSDVLAAIELKSFGVMGDKVENIKQVFMSINKLNTRVYCCYITLRDRTNYKYQITEKNLGYDAFCLFRKNSSRHYTSENIREFHQATGDWNRFFNKIASLIS